MSTSSDLMWCCDVGLIVKSGAWYTMPQSKDDLAPLKLGQGRDKSRQYLEQHPDLATKIEVHLLSFPFLSSLSFFLSRSLACLLAFFDKLPR